MAVHICRDVPGASASYPSNQTYIIQPYVLAIFLFRVLGFTQVGQTNFDLTSITYLKSSGTAGANGASINNGTGATNSVGVPSGIIIVSSGDIGRFLVLRSTANPLKNSGVFKITGVDVPNNRYVIDYRSADLPIAEATGAMAWWLYETDTLAPHNQGNNGGSGYRFNGAATASRIVLQSPHATAWQVRMSYTSDNITGQWSLGVGFSGTGAGDFPIGNSGGITTDLNLWFNDQASASLSNAIPSGGDPSSVSVRITIVGDDGGQAVTMWVRNAAGTADSFFSFGIPDNEPSPTPATVNRIFCIGTQGFQTTAPAFAQNGAGSGAVRGSAWGLTGSPVMAACGLWTRAGSQTQASGFTHSANAGDNPRLSATELLAVELFSGIAEAWATGSGPIVSLEPRRMGTVPYCRIGRANFANYTLATSNTFYHMRGGSFLTWGGTAVLA